MLRYQGELELTEGAKWLRSLLMYAVLALLLLAACSQPSPQGLRLVEGWSTRGDCAPHSPVSVGVGFDHVVHVTDAHGRRVLQCTDEGDLVRSFGETVLADPAGLAVGEDGTVFVCDRTAGSVLHFDGHGRFLGRFDRVTHPDSLAGPVALAIGRHESIVVLEAGAHRVRILDSDGTQFLSFGEQGRGRGQLLHPTDLALDSGGDIWVLDAGNFRLQEFGPEGEFLGVWGERGTGPGQFGEPTGLSIDGHGRIWIVDRADRRLQVFDAHMNHLFSYTHDGWGRDSLADVTVAPLGDLFVADAANQRILRFAPSF